MYIVHVSHNRHECSQYIAFIHGKTFDKLNFTQIAPARECKTAAALQLLLFSIRSEADGEKFLHTAL